ncbi:MAG: hypothetical protein FWD42_08435 [Solirubrobacterales bacterium]|nr:hypothetical protein [Solirubrobacterales bacterium]
MSERHPWERLRSALHREGPAPAKEPRPLSGVTVDDFREWGFLAGLTAKQPEEGLVGVAGAHRLGAVRAYCLVDEATGSVLGVDVAVTAAHPGALPDLAALLLQPVAAALTEPQRAALDTWLRGQLGHRGPYNAVTTLPGLQFAVAIDDANPRGRTWSLTARAT